MKSATRLSTPRSLLPARAAVAVLFGRAVPRGVRRALLFSVLVATGCGAEAPSSYHDYALQSAQLNCERLFRCCGRRCSTTADATFNNSIKTSEYAIAQGLVTYNPTQAKACLDATAALYVSCEQYVATIDPTPAARACTGILQGALPLGAACSQTTDYCTPSTYCALDSSLTPPQARCRRTLNIGDPCDGTVRCVAGSSCDLGGTRTCKANGTAGALGDACSATSPCGTALVCLPSATCGLPQDGGKACSADPQCLSGRCAVDTCAIPMSRPTTVSDLVCGGAVGP